MCDLGNVKSEEAVARVGPQRHRKKKIYKNIYGIQYAIQFPNIGLHLSSRGYLSDKGSVVCFAHAYTYISVWIRKTN